MLKNKKTAFVRWGEGDCVDVETYSDNIFETIFRAGKVPKSHVYTMMSYRMWPKDRPGIDEILKHLGLKEYDEEQILRKTHGLIRDDYNWIMFEDENINYDDIKIRD